MPAALGILGVGHLASYVIAGLRRAGDGRQILLSPRNLHQVARLVAQHHCQAAGSNQEVVDRSQVVLLSVRPHQLEELLKPLTFNSDHLVISCVAGVSLSQLQPMLGDARVVRTLPLACAEVGEGAVPLYPDEAVAQMLLSQLGQVIVMETEAQFDLASVAACMNGWMFRFFDELTQWYVSRGLSAQNARELVLQACSGAAALAAANPEQSLAAISDSIATDGTYTKRGLDRLESKGAFTPWLDACAEVEQALKS